MKLIIVSLLLSTNSYSLEQISNTFKKRAIDRKVDIFTSRHINGMRNIPRLAQLLSKDPQKVDHLLFPKDTESKLKAFLAQTGPFKMPYTTLKNNTIMIKDGKNQAYISPLNLLRGEFSYNGSTLKFDRSKSIQENIELFKLSEKYSFNPLELILRNSYANTQQSLFFSAVAMTLTMADTKVYQDSESLDCFFADDKTTRECEDLAKRNITANREFLLEDLDYLIEVCEEDVQDLKDHTALFKQYENGNYKSSNIFRELGSSLLTKDYVTGSQTDAKKLMNYLSKTRRGTATDSDYNTVHFYVSDYFKSEGKEVRADEVSNPIKDYKDLTCNNFVKSAEWSSSNKISSERKRQIDDSKKICDLSVKLNSCIEQLSYETDVFRKSVYDSFNRRNEKIPNKYQPAEIQVVPSGRLID